MVVRVWLVATAVEATLTPGIRAPVGSETVPVSADVLADCAHSPGHIAAIRKAITHAENRSLVDFIPPLLLFAAASPATTAIRHAAAIQVFLEVQRDSTLRLFGKEGKTLSNDVSGRRLG
jgi:hypothetical protein